MEFPAGNTQALVARNWHGRYQGLTCDALTGGILTADIEDVLTHLGFAFTVPNKDTDVDIIAPKEYLFIMPTDPDLAIHINFCMYLGTGGYVELFEAPTVTDNGTPLTAYNRNRRSTNTSEVQVFSDPTVTADGTMLDVTGVGAAGGNVKVGGPAQAGHWDLTLGGLYLLRTTVLTDNALVTLQSDWHEFDLTQLTFPDIEGTGSSSSA